MSVPGRIDCSPSLISSGSLSGSWQDALCLVEGIGGALDTA